MDGVLAYPLRPPVQGYEEDDLMLPRLGPQGRRFDLQEHRPTPMSPRPESNWQPPVYETGALPSELQGQNKEPTAGIEPATSPLPRVCSTN